MGNLYYLWLNQALILSLQGISSMSNSDKAADLLVPGAQYLADLINENNKTSYTPSDLIIGPPRASADQAYNTDVEVSFLLEPTLEDPTPDPVMGELHYLRFDLGRLFAKRSIKLRDNGYQTIRDLIAPLAEEVRIQFENEDIVDGPIPAGSPKSLIIQADPLSLRFIGRFSIDIVDPIVPDTSMIISPVVVPNTMPARMAMKSDDTLFYGNGNLSGGMLVAGNGEVEVAGAARLSTYRGVFNSTLVENKHTYHLDIADISDWTLPFSFALINKRNGDLLTDLYYCAVKITAQQGGGYLNFVITRQYGKLILWDAVNNLTVSDILTYNDEQTLFQNILRVTAFKHKLGSLTCNAIGAPYGVFDVEISAARKTEDQPTVTVAFRVVVSGTAP
jgi:hypothetical protein